LTQINHPIRITSIFVLFQADDRRIDLKGRRIPWFLSPEVAFMKGYKSESRPFKSESSSSSYLHFCIFFKLTTFELTLEVNVLRGRQLSKGYQMQ
jgi:hypothetical protein